MYELILILINCVAGTVPVYPTYMYEILQRLSTFLEVHPAHISHHPHPQAAKAPKAPPPRSTTTTKDTGRCSVVEYFHVQIPVF